MLEHDDRKHAAAELIGSLPCQVEIPAHWRENFEKHGMVPIAEGERRRYQRVYCRSENNRAAIQCQPTLPQLKREPTWQSAYLTNISRDGLGFLHCEPLYPREKLQVVTLTGNTIQVEVVCCRRISTRCYEIGTALVGEAEGNP